MATREQGTRLRGRCRGRLAAGAAGTPADHWADDAAGVALPAARPIGGFTAAQVEFAYQRTRTLHAAAALNRRTLLGGSPAAFAGLLTNQQRTWFLGRLDKTGLDKQGYELSSRTMVMSFAPGSAQLIGSVIKVHGTMRARSSTRNGYSYLDVHVDYLFVYPVQPPHRPTQWKRAAGRLPDRYTGRPLRCRAAAADRVQRHHGHLTLLDLS